MDETMWQLVITILLFEWAIGYEMSDKVWI